MHSVESPFVAKPSWKSRLYDEYISSGQAPVPDLNAAVLRPEQVFGVRAHHIRSVIARYLPQDRSSRIVDLACGSGAYLHYLRACGYTNISGVDVSPEQIGLARLLGIPNAECRDLRSELSELDSDSIDTVLVIDILEHLGNDELFEVVEGIFRVLKKGGSCVAHVPNAEGLYGMRVRYNDLTHERAFAPKSAGQLFLAVGFRDVQCFEERPVVHSLKSLVRRILWDSGTIAHRVLLAAETAGRRFILSQNMIVVANK